MNDAARPSAGTIWPSILEDRQRRALVFAAHGVDAHSLPDELFATLNRIYAIALEGRPLELADHRAFWDGATEGEGEACRLIDKALEDFSRRPLDIASRAFFDHLRHCARYLASQGYQGLEDDRNHWAESVTGDRRGTDNPFLLSPRVGCSGSFPIIAYRFNTDKQTIMIY